MTKDLWLMRHAEATAPVMGQPDRERELSNRGYQDATRLGHHLYAQRQHVDLMLVSTAQRTRRTAEIVVEQMRHSPPTLRHCDELYQASVRSVLDLINRQSADVYQLMVVGHNPTLTYLAEYLSGEPINNMVPGGLFSLRLLVDSWEEVTQHSVTQTVYIIPEQLRA